jgi:hypothetical protein
VNDEKTILELQLEKAMVRAMGDPEMRILLWHIVVDYLYVFDPSYAHNATAYSLLAKKETGLQILAWMKRVSPDGTYRAESEYNNLANEQEEENG